MHFRPLRSLFEKGYSFMVTKNSEGEACLSQPWDFCEKSSLIPADFAAGNSNNRA